MFHKNVLENENKEKIITLGDLTIDYKQKTVFRNNQEIRLTAKEFALLDLLVKNRGVVISKQEILEKVWKDWEAFAQYAFNKSHSTCYAWIGYQTAYLKAHYPGEFMSAVLNHAGSIEKITFFMEECKRMGLNVLGPDINESQNGFAVNKNGEIRFGFSGLKGVGEKAIEEIGRAHV